MLVKENEGALPEGEAFPRRSRFYVCLLHVRLHVCAHAWTENTPGRSGACDKWARWRDGWALFAR